MSRLRFLGKSIKVQRGCKRLICQVVVLPVLVKVLEQGVVGFINVGLIQVLVVAISLVADQQVQAY